MLAANTKARVLVTNLLTAYRNLETYAPHAGAGMLLIHLQPPFSVMQDDLRYGRAKMTR